MKSPATLSCFVALVAASLGCSARAVTSAAQSTAAGTKSPEAPAAAPKPGSVPAAAPAPASLVPSAPSAPSAPSVPSGPAAPPVSAELTALLGGVCQLVSRPGKTPSAGCACCAPFDECRPSDPPFTGYDDVFAPAQVIAGTFTRAGADQRALPIEGCEPHAANGGGMLLLERSPGGFVVERYIGSLFAGECQPVRRTDGRDLLVCARSDAHQGTGTVQLFQWDLAAPEEELVEAGPLLQAQDDEWSGCGSELGQAVSSTEIVRWAVRKAPGGARLSVDLDIREGLVTEPYLARCRRFEQMTADAGRDPTQRPRALLRHRRERQVFRFDGNRFIPGPG